MAYVQAVVFHQAKLGSTPAEWEDGAGYDPGDAAAGRRARIVLVDGATEAYDSIRWVGQLVESMLGVEPEHGAPALTDAALATWIDAMQRRWLERSPHRFATIYEERKFHQDGSFATLLACDLDGLDRPRPRLTAVALGDTVLFQVRADRLVAQFPALAAEDFGLEPDGVFTLASQRSRMAERLLHFSGEVQVGDRLFLATDALAAWIVRGLSTDGARVWGWLDQLRTPEQFQSLVAPQLASGRMKNDDLTLLRVRVVERAPELLQVSGP